MSEGEGCGSTFFIELPMFEKVKQEISGDLASTAKRCLRRNRDWMGGGKGGDSTHSSIDWRVSGQRVDSNMKLGSRDDSRNQSNNHTVNSINMNSTGLCHPLSQFSDSDGRTSSKLSSAGVSIPIPDTAKNRFQTLNPRFCTPVAIEGRMSQILGSTGKTGLGLQSKRHRDSESFAESTGHLITGVSALDCSFFSTPYTIFIET